MNFMWVWWWAFDDTLARVLGVPQLGELPFWVVLLFSFGLSVATSSSKD
jgi:hypothetical protein